MATGATKHNGVQSGANHAVTTGQAHSTVTQINDDARTAQGTGAALYNPLSIADAVFHWVRVQMGTSKCLVRARVPIATTAVATAPTVVVIGLFDTTNSYADVLVNGAGIQDGSLQPMRLDSLALKDTAPTLTLPPTPSSTSVINDGTWYYSDPISITPTFMQGCKWVGVAVTVAGAITPSAPIPIDIILEN